MGLIAPLAALFGLELEDVAARAKAAAILYGLMGLFLLAAVIFLTVAGYIALADLFSPLIAALILSGVFLLLALALYLGTLLSKGRQRRALVERRRSSESSAFLTTAALTALPVFLKSPMIVKLGLPAAAITAIALLRENSRDE
jgi:Ni/Fe-hydrogenase subunit HybB-like protein